MGGYKIVAHTSIMRTTTINDSLEELIELLSLKSGKRGHRKVLGKTRYLGGK